MDLNNVLEVIFALNADLNWTCIKSSFGANALLAEFKNTTGVVAKIRPPFYCPCCTQIIEFYSDDKPVLEFVQPRHGDYVDTYFYENSETVNLDKPQALSTLEKYLSPEILACSWFDQLYCKLLVHHSDISNSLERIHLYDR